MNAHQSKQSEKISDATDFGYESIPVAEKASRVRAVFDSVANKYDIMNDCMSAGMHRYWKHLAVQTCGLRPGYCVLDLAGGTGDLSAKISPLVGDSGRVVLADINYAMLQVGRDRLLDRGIYRHMDVVLANAETLPFPAHTFDVVIIGFGLRNVTHKDRALVNMQRVLKPGGKVVVLEFSHPVVPLIKTLYDQYSFKLLPKMGRWIAQDEASYRYLAESIRMHPDQDRLVHMMQQAGFEDCAYRNLMGGIVAIHYGYKY